jgi:hypothetical protein
LSLQGLSFLAFPNKGGKMAGIAGLWWLWLIIMILAGGYALFNQVRRIQGMTGEGDQDPFTAFRAGLGTLVVAGFIGSVSGLLLLIAVLYNIFH